MFARVVQRRNFPLIFVVFLWVMLALLFVPHRALAESDYSIDQVQIDATVKEDGSLEVAETRTFDFDGSFNGVYWKLPKGQINGNEVSPTILSVRVESQGTTENLMQDNSGVPNTYSVEDFGSYDRVKLYSPHSDEQAQFTIVYSQSNLATRWSDTSELYWKFVSDGWDVESQKVSCTIHLPVPAGETVVAGDNVRAWGHGPLDAQLELVGNDVVFTVPSVGTSEFAEARLSFPASWLSTASQIDQPRLQEILSEEQAWADESNARRAKAKAISLGFTAVGIVGALISLMIGVREWRRYKRTHTPQFDDKYFRDVPSDDHPAILGMLLHEGELTQECVTASIMRLSDNKSIALDVVEEKKKGFHSLGSKSKAYRLRRLKKESPEQKTASKAIDDATLAFLFDDIASKTASCHDDEESLKNDSLYFNDINKFSKKHPEQYLDLCNKWQKTVTIECNKRSFFKDAHGIHDTRLFLLSIVDGICAAVLLFLCIVDVIVWTHGLLAIVLLGVSAAVLMYIRNKAQKLSPEALELRAKLHALSRWLCDFTRLEEAIPQDVILWNKLLVMAVVLGVADEVIEQLRVAAPQLLEEPEIAPIYGWYMYQPGMHSAHEDFSSRAEEAHRSSVHALTNADIASSSWSSGSGGGGGFSVGGGGGFGGGGGGGAF